jgi:hypothetical protein
VVVALASEEGSNTRGLHFWWCHSSNLVFEDFHDENSRSNLQWLYAMALLKAILWESDFLEGENLRFIDQATLVLVHCCLIGDVASREPLL